MAIFQRRHYQAIAEVLQECHRLAPDPYSARTVYDVKQSLAQMLSRDNPDFSRERFLKACRMEETNPV